MRSFGIIIFILIFQFKLTLAQKAITDTLYTLKETEISGFRFSKDLAGIKTEVIDSNAMQTFQTSNLGELLMHRTLLYIKSVGIAGLSSVSIRGTGTSHTAVLWNGFAIQNPMNGGVDFSLIPVNFSTNISVRYNGMSSLYGSGAIGGTIHLSNVAEFNKGWQFALSGNYGSFSNFSGNAKINWSNKISSISLKTLYHQARNDFPYTNTAMYDSPKIKQGNAEMSHFALMFENDNKINEKNLLTLRFWYQTSDRNIPPVMTREFSDANQNDESYRSAFEWKNDGKKYRLSIRSALFVENYHYKEEIKDINSSSRSFSSISEAEIYVKIFPFHSLNVGLHYNYLWGNTDYYQTCQYQQDIALFISYLMTDKRNKLKMNLSLRQEYTNGNFVPILPSLGMDFRIHKELFLYANISRNFRMPTLNDLFWYPGGNPELKPENGFSEEIGLKHSFKWKRNQIHYNLSAFNNNVENWILWLPSGSYWSPMNIQSVWSRGAEALINYDYSYNKIWFTTGGKLSYVKSTVRKSTIQSAIDKQLIYTPEVNVNINLGIAYRHYWFGFNVDYVSSRYVSADNSDKIKPYCLGNIQLSKEFQLKKITINLYFQLNNLWNQSYQTIVWQAMPGINMKTGINFIFKHKPNNSEI